MKEDNCYAHPLVEEVKGDINIRHEIVSRMWKFANKEILEIGRILLTTPMNGDLVVFKDNSRTSLIDIRSASSERDCKSRHEFVLGQRDPEDPEE